MNSLQINSLLIAWLLSINSYYSCKAQRNNKDFEVANAYFEIGEYSKAEEYYKICYQQSPSIATARKIAQCNHSIRNYIEAEFWYSKVYKSKTYTPQDLRQYCEILKMNEKYDLAKKIAQVLAKDDRYKGIAASLIASCDSSMSWLSSDTRVKAINLKKVNTEYSEIAPAYFKDGIVFCTTREKNLIKKKTGFSDEPFYNLYFGSHDSNEVWHCNSFSFFLNTTDHEGPVTFNKTFDNIYLTRCKSGQSKLDSLNTNHLKLYKAQKQGIGWSKPEQFMINDSTYSFGHPSISDDEKIFFFASNMAGGFGGTDIYACFKIDSTKWSLPINLGASINTEYNELFPFIHSGGILYFSSDKVQGIGGFDIYQSAIINGEWQQPSNMKFPINSAQDDYSFIIDENNIRGFLSSNRKGGKGKEDLYMIRFE